jgi:hypothetical protein
MLPKMARIGTTATLHMSSSEIKHPDSNILQKKYCSISTVVCARRHKTFRLTVPKGVKIGEYGKQDTWLRQP